MGDCVCSPTLHITLPISQIKRILRQCDVLGKMRVNALIWSAPVFLLQNAPLSGWVGGWGSQGGWGSHLCSKLSLPQILDAYMALTSSRQ